MGVSESARIWLAMVPSNPAIDTRSEKKTDKIIDANRPIEDSASDNSINSPRPTIAKDATSMTIAKFL